MGQFFWLLRQDVSYYWEDFDKDNWRAALNALPYCFSTNFWNKVVKFLLAYDFGNITKQN